MASVAVEGMNELITKLENGAGLDDETVEEMLFAAGDVLVDCIREELRRSRYRVDELAGRVRYQKTVRRDKNGDPYIRVTATGKTRSGQNAATVLFVLNYGRAAEYGEIPGAYFWTKGTKNAEKLIQQRLEELTAQKLQERGLL